MIVDMASDGGTGVDSFSGRSFSGTPKQRCRARNRLVRTVCARRVLTLPADWGLDKVDAIAPTLPLTRQRCPSIPPPFRAAIVTVAAKPSEKRLCQTRRHCQPPVQALSLPPLAESQRRHPGAARAMIPSPDAASAPRSASPVCDGSPSRAAAYPEGPHR